MRAILEHAGAIVTTAGSADEALARIRNERPDLIVSDIGMPEQDAKAFLRELPLAWYAAEISSLLRWRRRKRRSP